MDENDMISLTMPPTWNDAYPDPTAKSYWDLAKERIYYLTGEIQDNALQLAKVITACNAEDVSIEPENRKPITIVISSPGGYLDDTFHLCDVITGSKTPVYTVNGAQACSGAALVLIAGHKRFSLPHAFAMIHTGSGGISGTYEQAEAAQANYRRQVANMKQFILAHTQIEEKTFKRNQSKDWYFAIEDQLKYGLIDGVVNNIYDLGEVSTADEEA